MAHDSESSIRIDSELRRPDPTEVRDPASPTFTSGLVLGLLIGGGHFGGDGRQPQVTLRMHVRHEPLLRLKSGHIC